MPYVLWAPVKAGSPHRAQHTGSNGLTFVSHGVVVGRPKRENKIESTPTTH